MPYGQEYFGNFSLTCLLLIRDLKLGVTTLKTGCGGSRGGGGGGGGRR